MQADKGITMSNSETLQQEKLQPTRRAVLKGSAALAAAAVLEPAASPAQSRDAEGSRYSGDHVAASIKKNIVETDSGKISGYQSGGIVTFKGIPYGASTGGAGRFMPAAKPQPWTGVRSTLHWGWVCPQGAAAAPEFMQRRVIHDESAFLSQGDQGQPDEDCLRVNVWTSAADSGKRPVMFWIHGGGFSSGSANESAAYDGENLARRGDVVVVSINHRLGPLGFLDLSEYGSQYAQSGNVGILDLVAALEWVKVNIGNFGGDPGKVLIFGQSGGGGKVSTLMGMPAAKGLFHRAVIQSAGDALSQLPQDVSRRTTAAVLKELGIDPSSIGRIHEIPNENILEAAARVSRQAGSGVGSQPGFGGWAPVVNGHDLPRKVWEPAAPEPSATVPLMVGSTLNEMTNSMADAALEEMSMDEVRKRLNALFPNRANPLIEAISKAHIIRKPFDIYAISGGFTRRADALTMAIRMADQGHAPTFVYKWVWQSPILDGRPRAYHTGELPFVFYNTERCSSETGGGPEPMELAERVCDAWINFARKGDPNHPGLPKWEAFSKDTKPTMVLDTKCELKKNLDDAELEAANFGT